MNKGELVDYIAEDLEVSKAMADRFINCFVEAVCDNIRKDGVRLAGFGTFLSAKRKARVGRNPRTGESIQIAASQKVKFLPAKSLKEMFNR